MNYHHPDRPRLGNGTPQYCHNGKPVGALAALQFTPTEDPYTWTISVLLMIGPNRASWFYQNITGANIQDALKAFEEHPERFFEETFGWVYDPTPAALPESKAAGSQPKKAQLSLDDLD